MSCIASPEPMALPSMVKAAPEASFGCAALNCRICSSSQVFFSLLYATSTDRAGLTGGEATAIGDAGSALAVALASGCERLQPLSAAIPVNATAKHVPSRGNDHISGHASTVWLYLARLA